MGVVVWFGVCFWSFCWFVLWLDEWLGYGVCLCIFVYCYFGYVGDCLGVGLFGGVVVDVVFWWIGWYVGLFFFDCWFFD